MKFDFEKLKNFDEKKWWPRIILALALIGLTIVEFCDSEQFTIHFNFISIVTTLFFVFYTYEMVRITRDIRKLPFISVKLIVASKIDDNFLEKYGSQIKKTAKFNRLIEEAKNPEGFNKNIIFVGVENTGDANAINAILDLSYEKKNLGEIGRKNRTLEFGNIKKNQSIIEMIEIYDIPTQNDYFKIKESIIEFNDVGARNAGEKPQKEDFSRTAKIITGDEGVSLIVFLKELE